MAKKKLALFDLDGTLFNTNDVNYCAYAEALKQINIQLEKDFFINKCMGKHYKEFLPMLIHREEDIELVHAKKKELYAEYVCHAIENEALFSLIDSIKDDYYLGIVTTASRQNTYDILRYFGHEDDFELIITQEDVENKKPNPEGFIKAMEHFQIKKENTIVFEDSGEGIQAAKDAGATVFIVNKDNRWY